MADPKSAYHILRDETLEVSSLKPRVHVFTNLTVRGRVKTDGVPEDVLKPAEIRKLNALTFQRGSGSRNIKLN